MNNLKKSDSLDDSAIAIIGMAGRFPGAKNIDEFWDNLQNGVESISFFTEEELKSSCVDPEILSKPNYVKAGGVLADIDLFDASFFGFNPKEAAITDPQHRLFLECAWEALENAGYDAEKFPGRIGVYAGAGMNTYAFFNLSSNRALIDSVNGFQVMIGNDKDFMTTRASYKLNLKGPSITVQSACSTGLVSVHLACQSLLNGECDMALAGAAKVNVRHNFGYLYEEGGVLSPDGHCRAFDAKAQGTVFGNGVGIVVLKRLAEALEHGDCIHAVIKGSAINNDGSLKVGYTAPSQEGQAEVIAEAIAMAEVEPETVTYIETHGTGTALGDPIEIAALTQVFLASTKKQSFCGIGSVKTNIGHLDTAAGIASLIKTVLALKHRLLPPSLHFEQINPNIDLINSPFYVNSKLSKWETDSITPLRAGVSSFGFGGTNAHIVLEEAPMVETSQKSRPWHLLLLSAKTKSTLEKATTNLIKFLKNNPDINLADVAYTSHVGRKDFDYRQALTCHNIEDAVTVLESLHPKRVFTATQETKNQPIVFMFPGQGSQYENMGLDLYQSEPTFRQQVDLCCEILKPHLGLDLRHVLYPSENPLQGAAQQLEGTVLAQPAIFVIEYALAKLLMEWGLCPQIMIGHSVGEYVAACLAGVLSLEDVLVLVAARGRLIQELPAGKMLAVRLGEAEVRPLLNDKLSLAASNAPFLCVVSGSIDAVDALQNQLVEKGVDCQQLHTSHAFHSEMMEPILEQFIEYVKKVNFQSPQIPYLSNVTGTWITDADVVDPVYWAKHLRQTVRFTEGLQELLKKPDCILLEVGPGRTLSTLVRQHPSKPVEQVVLSSLRHPQDRDSDVVFLLNTLGKLWLAGITINWSGFYAHEQRHRLPLPTYPFERQRYWVEPQQIQFQFDGNTLQESLQNIDTIERLPSRTGVQKPEHSQHINSSSRYPRPNIQTAYVAPSNPLEQTIAEIYQDLLGIDLVGIHDDFFDLGGHSLLATQLATRVRNTLQVELSLRILSNPPSVAGLAEAIEEIRNEGQATITAIDLKAEAVLDPTISFEGVPFEYVSEPAHIFLTGGSGYLGAFILHELLEQTKADIYCLIRGSSVHEGKNRLQQNLQIYLRWNETYSPRIIPVIGDLSQPLMGLSDEEFKALAGKIDTIYHNGSWVNFIFPYSFLKPTNVLGTQEIIRFASQIKLKPLHYVSSIEVFQSFSHLARTKVVEIFEDDEIDNSEGFFTGYAQTKWVAEKLVRIAGSKGLPMCIYRPGNVSGDSITGICNTDDLMIRLAKGFIQLGIAPVEEGFVDLTPVNYVAEALVYLSRQKKFLGKVFQLTNPQYPRWSKIANWMRSFGYPLELMSFNKWRETTINVGSNSQENALYPVLTLVADWVVDEGVEISEEIGRRYDCQNTIHALADTSITCPPVDDKLLRKYFSYFIRSGFLSAPQLVS